MVVHYSIAPPVGDVTLEIVRLAGLGDGVADWNGLPVYVPYTHPGDVIRARLISIGRESCRGEMTELLTAAPERQTPPCAHFGDCGGCGLQHLAAADYSGFKTAGIRNMLRRLGVESSVLLPTTHVGEAARRRIELRISSEHGRLLLGFMGARSHRLVEILACPASLPEFSALLPRLRECLENLKRPIHLTGLHVTRLPEGFDLLFAAKETPSPQNRAKLAALAENADILRVSLERQGAVQRLAGGPVAISLGMASVELPPGAFLQATLGGQQAITRFILKHLEDSPRVLDLFSGCGSYSFPLLESPRREVHAYEGDAEMIAAMHNALRRHGLEGRATASVRDLHRSPLKEDALRGWDAVVINPPRNGASPQVRALADAGIARIVMVSCNPATFERDAQTLLASRYRLREILPIDQFHWNAHMELAACFSRF